MSWGMAVIRPQRPPRQSLIEVYMRQTAPLEMYYQRRDLLDTIDGAQPVAAVQAAIQRELRQRRVHP